MKQITAFTIVALLGILPMFSQIYEPVKWNFQKKKISENEYDLTFTATIEPGWHIYSQVLESDMGPIPTTFDFKKLEGAERVGKVKEPKAHKEYDPNFDMELSWFGGTVVFTQRVKVNSPTAKVEGELTYMACDDSKCLPPEYLDFSFELAGQVQKNTTEANTDVPEPEKARDSEEITNTPSPFEGGGDVQAAVSEIFSPVTWSFAAKDLGNEEYELQVIADIQDHWHLYSMHLPSEDGPIATEVNWIDGPHYKRLGETEEVGKVIQEYDLNFMMELTYFEHEAMFVQKVKASGKEPIEGEVYYMVCDAEKCLPPESVEFIFTPADGKGMLKTASIENDTLGAAPLDLRIETVDLSAPISECSTDEAQGAEEGSSLWTIFILGFLGGLVALLTPCVFPMIPLTVSFFTKSSQSKRQGVVNAISYGLCIFLIYVVLSLPFHFLDSLDPEILNTISTNVWLNVAFFVIFVVFAISFFGYFEITLPSNMANRVDRASNFGGILGIFFMALTLAIVSFSCTGPILGSLLAGSLTSSGGALQLTMGMGGFGLALALPFGLFAAFPGWLNSLPRSGSWLNTVKVVLGFVELALAVKFLSNADLVEHWGLLKREIFFALWIIIGIGLALYLFGFIHFPHDSKGVKISKPRMALAVIVLLFVAYISPGVTNTKYANVQLLSGFPPPLFYSIYEQESECPLGIRCFKDYEEGLAVAKAEGKPIMLDFTGWACVNCRRMEENVWVKDEIFQRLNEDFVLISLYVDDRKNLPEEEQYEFVTRDGRTKKIKTVGNKWATLQTETFANNSQPYYALLTPDEELLNLPVGYTPEVTEYQEFLDCGLEAFKRSQEEGVAQVK